MNNYNQYTYNKNLSPWPYMSDGRKIVALGNSSRTACSPAFLDVKNPDPLDR
jgi:hypothetical protein